MSLQTSLKRDDCGLTTGYDRAPTLIKLISILLNWCGGKAG